MLRQKPSLPQNRLIAMAVKRLLLRQSAKAGGGAPPGICECQYHAHAYNEVSGTASPSIRDIRLTHFSVGATILSQTITITEDCCIRAVGTILAWSAYSAANFELEHPLGTIVTEQESETTSDDISMFHYSAWEVLPAGTYTYYLVNRAASARDVYAAQLKIEAVSCTAPPCACQHHADVYGEVIGIGTLSNQDMLSDHIAIGATILSQAITITETCCILAVGTILGRDISALAYFELEQPLGTIVVDQENKTLCGDIALLHYAAWEVLSPGTYTYNLVNRSAVVREYYAAQLKIIAVECVMA